jgi:hypothetical protein
MRSGTCPKCQSCEVYKAYAQGVLDAGLRTDDGQPLLNIHRTKAGGLAMITSSFTPIPMSVATVVTSSNRCMMSRSWRGSLRQRTGRRSRASEKNGLKLLTRATIDLQFVTIPA